MSGLRERMNRLRGRAAADRDGEAGARPEAASETSTAPEEREERLAGAETAREPERAADPREEALPAAWQAMNVALERNDWGEFLLRRIEYPLAHRHGVHRLSELAEAAGALAAFHDGGEADVDAERLLFLDLETTGLGVGTGNVPFMTGLAHVEGGRFVVEQALIRHPAEERAMLAYIRDKLADRPYLVTYNGRTFDWPVLAGRYIMNGLGRMEREPRHLDFLHPSRSIWRNTLTSCRLSHVEEERLGISRTDDVPGSLAPSIYFQFLADGRPEPLAGVFRHNELDMLSLAALAVRFGRLLGGGLGAAVPYPTEPEELLRTGLWLERMGRAAEAEVLYRRFVEAEPPSALAMAMAARDKKCGNWARAVLLWQKAALAAERSPLATGEAHIELAMYYEHRAKDIAAALRCAERAHELALNRLAARRNDPKRRAEAEATRKRLDRLHKKARRNPPCEPFDLPLSASEI